MSWLIYLELASAIVSVALGAGIFARDHGLKANRLIAAFLFCNAWWACAQFFLFQQADPEVATTILRLTSIGWLPLGVLCLHTSVTLSSMKGHPVAQMISPLYVAIAIVLPVGLFTNLVISGAEPAGMDWRPLFGPGMIVAYGLLAIPVIATLWCWRGVMAVPENGGQLQLARIIFFGLSGALLSGTLTSIVLPLLGIVSHGITTALIALIGLGVAWTLRQFGHSLISPQAFAREILDTLEDGVVLIGEGGVVRNVNRAFLRMVGAREFDAVDQPITRWIPDFPDCRESSQSPTLMEIQTSAGEMIPVVVSAPIAFRGAGRLVGQAFLLRDRREIVSLQRQLVLSARLAAVGDLSKSISRSIDEPVLRTRGELEKLSVDWKAIEQILESVEPDGLSAEAVEEGFELIGECVEGVDRILSVVKEISGFSSECTRENFERQRLDRIVSRALRIARVHAPDWLEIETHLDSGILIDCHSAQIERVATNLLLNAIQALEKNSKEAAHLVITVAARGDRALLHIEDDGCGIEPEVLERIFDPFFTTKPVGKGTGLGLAISYHIVKDHGGEIRVSSSPSRGTSVIVDLPRTGIVTGAGAEQTGQH